MNVPNSITIVRLLIVPVFGYYMYHGQYILAIALFLLAGATDILDGFIARKFNMITAWGKIADPLADKLMQLTALLALVFNGLVPLLFLVVIFAKELTLMVGGFVLYKKNIIVSSRWYGKLATVVLYVAVVGTVIFKSEAVASVLMGMAVISALFSLLMYYVSVKEKIRD